MVEVAAAGRDARRSADRKSGWVAQIEVFAAQVEQLEDGVV